MNKSKVSGLLIGVAGKARVGKDTIGEYLEHNYGFVSCSFAKPVYDAVSVIFGIDIADHIDTKEDVIPYWGMSLRQMLQKVGTECGREILDPEIWVKRLALDLDHNRGANVVVTDIRFDNESELIRGVGGVIVHVSRDHNIQVQGHKSESGIAECIGDLYIDNNGTLIDLHTSIESILNTINK